MQKSSLAAAVLCALMASPAHAVLVVDITGTPGSGTTVWTFSGSATATLAGDEFNGSGDVSTAEAWNNVGDYTIINDLDIPDEGGTGLSGAATVTIGSSTFDIDQLYVDDDPGGDDDEFGIGLDSGTDVDIPLNALVSWTGVLTVTNLDLLDLDESGLPFSFTSNELAGLDLRVNIGSQAAIPLPAAGWLLVAGMGGLALVRRGRPRSSARGQMVPAVN